MIKKTLFVHSMYKLDADYESSVVYAKKDQLMSVFFFVSSKREQ